MTATEQADETQAATDEAEALKLLMAHYAHWGDTQQWD